MERFLALLKEKRRYGFSNRIVVYAIIKFMSNWETRVDRGVETTSKKDRSPSRPYIVV